MDGFGDWYGQTTLHPVGLTATLMLGTLLLLVHRRYASLPILTMACFIAPAQRIVIAGLDFNLIRVLVLIGWIRIFLRQEYRDFRWHAIDFATLAWAAAQTLIYTLQQGTSSAFVNRLGVSFDVVGMYFLFRMIVVDWDSILMIARGLVWLSIPVLMAFVVEHHTGRNLFAFLGGVPEFTVVRDGRLRCQGAFAHAILAGTFWAAVAPLLGAMWWRGWMDRTYALLGVSICVALVVLCASSTPVAGLACGVAGAIMWPLRRSMRLVRWSLVVTLCFLHMIMKNPVWHLLARIDFAGGSTGYHRFLLVDQFIRRFGEWWLLGTPSTAHWGLGLEDVTNQYVLEGVLGGLLGLSIFLVIVVLGYREVGRIWRAELETPWHAAFAWSLGVALFVHTMAFFGVSYFGQITVIWQMLLAMIVGVGHVSRKGDACPKEL